jgi:two-component system, OmpR family, response regulator
MNVLLIDDDDSVRMLARISLVKVGGMHVTEASSGPEGLVAAAQDPPDVILLDVMMPGMDGPSTFTALKANARTAGIPVIFLTAKAMPTELARLSGLGAIAVLTKPFDPLTLAADVRRALGTQA